MKTRIFNLIILDESGSMCSIKQQAISGVNETIQTIRAAQKKYEELEQYVTLVSFNSEAVKSIHDKLEIEKVKDLTGEEYIPNCSTPLYDAMGIALNNLRKSVAKDDKVLVTIITDGYENSSREYNGKAIKALVEELKSEGWVFTYIGANQNVEEVGASLSITNVLNFDTSDEGTKQMFSKENLSRSRWFHRVANKDSDLDENFFEE